MSMSVYNAQKGTIMVVGDGFHIEIDLAQFFPLTVDEMTNVIIFIDNMPVCQTTKCKCFKQMLIYLRQEENNRKEVRYSDLCRHDITLLEAFLGINQQ